MKIPTKIVINAFLLTSLCFSEGVLADSLRCNNKVIKTGDTTTTVRLKCGEPFEKQYIGQIELTNRIVNLDRFTYVPSPGKLIKVLDFHDGKLVKIENGPRVQK